MYTYIYVYVYGCVYVYIYTYIQVRVCCVVTSLSSCDQSLIKLLEMYKVVKLWQQLIPSKALMWLYEHHNSSSVPATDSNSDIFLRAFLPTDNILRFVHPDMLTRAGIELVDKARR